MKVLTFNTFLTPLYSSNISKRLRRIINFLTKCDVDIICLQECFWGSRLLIKELSEFYPYNSGKPKRHYKRLVNSGLLILSKYPLENIEFGNFNDLLFPDSLSNKGWISCNVGIYKLVNTHLQAYQQPKNKLFRVKNLNQLKGLISSNVVMCGDFNIDFWGEEFKQLQNDLALNFSEVDPQQRYSFDPAKNDLALKSEKSGHLFDYFLYGSYIKANHLKVLIPDSSLSDHYPTVIELAFTS